MRAVPATLAVAVAFGIIASRAAAAPQGKLSGVDGNTATAGNGYYNVHVERLPGAGIGLYTATTGPLHPAGAGLNLLFGSGTPGTSYTTIRSYTSGTDYVQVTSGTSSSFAVVSLDPWARGFAPLGTTGFETTYVVAGADQLTVMQVARVNGSTAANSSVEVTTTVRNDGQVPIALGIRNLWDFQVGLDDGPPLQEVAPDGGVQLAEIEYLQPPFESFRVMDNELLPAAPTLAIVGTVIGPSSIQPPPSPPDALQFVCWQDAHHSAFDYVVIPARSVATAGSGCAGSSGGGDSAAAYFWGPTQSGAITIPPGGSRTFSASLRAEQPPTCTGVAQQYGQGCVGSNAETPDMRLLGCAEIGSTLTLDVSRGVGGGRAAVLFGAGRAAIQAGTCTLLVQQPLLALPVQLGGAPGVGGAGSATVQLALPGVPASVGATFALQTFVLDAGAPSGLSATRAMQVFVGF